MAIPDRELLEELENQFRKPFYEMSFEAREFMRRQFANVEWFSTDENSWKPVPFKKPGQMNKEAYRIVKF